MRNPLGLKRGDGRLLTRKRKEALKVHYGTRWTGLPRYSMIGGYDFVYYAHDLPYGRDVFEVCAGCAEELGDKCFAYEIYLEGPSIECAHQGEACVGSIKAAYGDPDSDEEEDVA